MTQSITKNPRRDQYLKTSEVGMFYHRVDQVNASGLLMGKVGSAEESTIKKDWKRFR
jgi:hypothetical protein